jgi:hypothetical protein
LSFLEALMRYLSVMGYLYKVSERNYKRYLREVASQADPDLANFGKQLGEVVNVTDLEAEEAALQLQALKERT